MLSLLAFATIAQVSDIPVLLEGTLCHPNRLLVKLSDFKARQNFARANVRVIRWMPEIGYVIVDFGRGKLQLTRRALKSLAGVERVDLDRAARPAYDPNDPMWPDMWHMTAIKANLAWDHSFGGPVPVAVIDTGVLLSHEDLAANAWVNAGEIPGNGIDDDGNGYVDDVNGYDFAYNDPDPDDVYGHGTACAGIVAAVQDNFLGVTGVAPRAKIMALKACLDSGYFFDSMTVPAYLYAANNGAKVLSMSYYSDHVSRAEGDAIKYCWNHGVLPVAAAGNDASVYPIYPGGYENTLSVAALGTNLLKAGFSNYGAWVDVAAPGVSLRSTAANGGYTSGFGGTSGACPHVAGLAALLFGANPSATAQQVRSAIEDTATAINQLPYGEFCNYGMIDCEAAMLAILGSPAPARSPIVRYMAMCGQQSADYHYRDDVVMSARIYGRGFQAPRTVRVTMGSRELTVENQTRNWIDVELLPPMVGTIRVYVDNQLISSMTPPFVFRRSNSLIEASSPGASVVGGFIETLFGEGSEMRVTRRGDGVISMQSTFRRVTMRDRVDLVFRRRYTLGGGTETIYLYDWSSASYPYGNFIPLSTIATPITMTETVVPLGNISRYIDFEGTMYLLVETSNNMPSGAELRVDACRISEH